MDNGSKEKTGVIYRIYHKETMRSYVGQTCLPERRIRDHFNLKQGCLFIQRAIKKYGKDAFVVEILEKDVPESQLSKMEILCIRFFNSKAPNGYNLTEGGEGSRGLIHSDTTRRRISEAKKGSYPTPEQRKTLRTAQAGQNNGFFGKTHSPETRKKLSEAAKGRIPWNKGKTHSPKTREKMALNSGRKGKPPWNKGKTGIYSDEALRALSDANKGNTWNKGKKHSDETRQKISENHADVSGANNPNYGKTPSSETLRKIRSPDYEPAHAYYLSLPSDMPLSEKRRLLREQFPNRGNTTICRWVRCWESDRPT